MKGNNEGPAPITVSFTAKPMTIQAYAALRWLIEGDSDNYVDLIEIEIDNLLGMIRDAIKYNELELTEAVISNHHPTLLMLVDGKRDAYLAQGLEIADLNEELRIIHDRLQETGLAERLKWRIVPMDLPAVSPKE